MYVPTYSSTNSVQSSFFSTLPKHLPLTILPGMRRYLIVLSLVFSCWLVISDVEHPFLDPLVIYTYSLGEMSI
jgi:hypothetical protein